MLSMGLIHAVFPRHGEHVDAPAQQLARAGAALRRCSCLKLSLACGGSGAGPWCGAESWGDGSAARGLPRVSLGGTAHLHLLLPSVPRFPSLLQGAGLTDLVPSPAAPGLRGTEGDEPELIPRPVLPPAAGRTRWPRSPSGFTQPRRVRYK